MVGGFRLRTSALCILTAVLLVLSAACFADGPVASSAGKLYGMTMVSGGPGGDDQGPDLEVLFPIYESSAATVQFVGVDWGNCEKSDPGTGASKYDFSQFEKQLFLKSKKTRICWVGIGCRWAENIKEKDPARYWKLAGNFVTAFVKHANQLGITYFQVPGNEYDLLGRGDWAQLYVEPLKHIYPAVKRAGKNNVVIAGNLSNGGDDVIQSFYNAGAKGYFDVLDLHAYSNNPKTGVDIFQVVEAHRAMERNGDGDKQIFLGEGWGPAREIAGITRSSHNETPSEAEIDAMRGFVENGFRNMLTERDIFDPKWIIGARFFTMDDNYGQGQWKPRAKYVDENGDGKPEYVLLDGYRFPADFNIEPKFFNGGLIDFNAKPKADLLDMFCKNPPDVKIEAKIITDGPSFGYTTETPYKLAITVSNATSESMKLDKFDVSWHTWSKGFAGISVQPDADMPTSLAPGSDAAANFTITLPKEAAGKEITLIGELNYKLGDRKHLADAWLTIVPISKIETTLLPARVILTPEEKAPTVGLSVINHSETPLDGKIKITAPKGLKVAPSEIDSKIDAQGLEAYMFSVAADAGTQPGHYAAYINVADQTKDWVAVDVPVIAPKAKSPIKVDGNLNDWKEAASIKLGNPAVGTVRFMYDSIGFYAAFEIDDAVHMQNQPVHDLWRDDSIQFSIDPLMNGARTARGGYKDDDYEYGFAQLTSGAVVSRSKAGAGKPLGIVKNVKLAFKRDGNKSIYEIALPWSEMEPFNLQKSKMFGLSILINDNDGQGRRYTEWGGGIAAEGTEKDPRLCIPVILTK